MAYSVEAIKTLSGPMPPAAEWGTYIEDLHALGFKGQGITVAVVDSGIDLNDPVSKAALVGGVNLVPGEDPTDLQDRIGHGSLVVRIILAIAPEAKIYMVRIFGSEGSTDNETAAHGISVAVDHGDLTNASIGGETSQAMWLAIRRHETAAKPLIAAAGNSAIDGGTDATAEPESPGSDPYTTTIGAIDRGAMAGTGSRWDWIPLRPAEYSSSYPEVDAVAIGRIPELYDQGTSFAAPVVAGIMAVDMSLAKAIGQAIDDEACYLRLISRTRQLPGLPAKNDQTGHGMVTMRPFQIPRTLEVDVKTMAAYLNGQPIDWRAKAGLENRAPGGIYGWLRPIIEALGGRVEFDAARGRARYRL